MRNTKPSRQDILYYIYEKGLESTSKLYNISKEEIENIISPPINRYIYEHKTQKRRANINNFVSSVIEKNYKYLHDKFVNDKNTLRLSQSKEDVFQNTILKVIESPDIIENNIIEYIERKLNIAYNQLILDNHQLKNIFTDAITEKK